MNQFKIRNTLCSKHGERISSICCSNRCQIKNSTCFKCISDHKQHPNNLLTIQKFPSAILTTLHQQNRRDIQAMKQNDILKSSLHQYRKKYDSHEEQLLKTIITILESEKSEITHKIQKINEIIHEKNTYYLQKLNRKKLLAMRIKFSSQKGLEYFNKCYSQNQNDKTMNNNALQELDLSFSLTYALRDFIKLKVSKTEALKISEFTLLHSKKPIKNNYHPPISPKKKQKNKTILDLKLGLHQC